MRVINSDGSEHSLENCWCLTAWGSTPQLPAFKNVMRE
jgi:hypothetical protein